MAFEGPVDDRLAIHELVAAYADAVTCNDAQAWSALWAEDGVWELSAIPGMEHVVGRDAIVKAWRAAMDSLPPMVATSMLGAVTINGDTATGRAYPREFIIWPDGKTRTDTGRYDDTYVKREGRWLFLSRTYTSLHSA
ncbi:nuclear transport factor 2 family protein [Emcibacter sp. SYSU 3D8]|uniref:nuclear transport factor 2 family protein n=1 Tax=Emcibacter sp. SYSU 3D8 TaxID=3133969 RepID=UPI0031FE7063